MLLGVTEVAAVKECSKEYGYNITYVWSGQVYADHLSRTAKLANPTTREELVEGDNCRLWCVRSFLLDLLGCTLFTNKSNMKIEVIYLETMLDLSIMGQ